MATSESADATAAEPAATAPCDGDCGDRYRVEDLTIVSWPNPGGATERFSDQLCESCVRKMCEAVGLTYTAPENPPEPVDFGGDA